MSNYQQAILIAITCGSFATAIAHELLYFWLKPGRVLKGKVVGRKKNDDFGSGVTFQPTIEYEVDGQQYRFRSKDETSREPKKGQSAYVFHSEAHGPHLYSHFGRIYHAAAPVLTGCILTIWLLLSYYRR